MFVCYFIGKMDLMWPNRMNSIKCCFVHQQNFWYTQHVFKFPMIPLPYNFFFSFLLLILHSFLPNRRFVLVRGLPWEVLIRCCVILVEMYCLWWFIDKWWLCWWLIWPLTTEVWSSIWFISRKTYGLIISILYKIYWLIIRKFYITYELVIRKKLTNW